MRFNNSWEPICGLNNNNTEETKKLHNQKREANWASRVSKKSSVASNYWNEWGDYRRHTTHPQETWDSYCDTYDSDWGWSSQDWLNLISVITVII